ncbi:SAV_2336 N-terminal domain-related protein [Calothrix sp. NIES-2098]|uniref:SAV_2336 N-terminal domain-related protein n=1 Tax=Calothrix sp. NIES-2098 TaxID=1954171 RepID=UPI000B5EF0CD|nr:WD-40 repeat-containing protein [Calothrix sp. NIES-2098]
MNQPKYSIEFMSEADWQKMPESGKRLIEMLVARIEQLESKYAELKDEDGQLLLAKFIATFGELGLIGEEIADIIWLTSEIQQYEQLFSPTKDSSGESKAKKSDKLLGSPIDSNIPIAPSAPSATSSTSSLLDSPKQSATSPTRSSSDSPRQVEIHASEEQPSKKSAHASRDLAIRLPDARSLQEPLTLARALHPLLRRVPSANMVLDEAATIERIAEEQLWTLVLKPDLEPWLDLALVVDESKSMLLWQPTIRELQRLLERYGIFRDVRIWGMVIDQVIDKNGQVQRQVRIRPGFGKAARTQRTHSPGELIDPQGRRLVLIATDCVASHWHDGTVLSTLKTWSQSCSTAIIQMLPEWLWSRTALGLAAPVRFQALLPGLPSQHLKAKPLSAWDEIDFETGIQVPIVTLEPEIFTVWSQLVAGKGGVRAPGFVFEPELFEPDEEEENSSDNDLSAEQRVRRFYNSASPMAWKLACLLAAAPIINLPVVRIIQDQLLHNKSKQVHVAEVFLGGLLRPLQSQSEITPDTNPDTIRYDFVEGVRAALLESSLRSDSVDVLKVVSQFVDSRIGRSIADFVAYLRDPDQIRDGEIQSSPIATVTTQILKQLGGEYARYAEQLESVDESTSDVGDYPTDQQQSVGDVTVSGNENATAFVNEAGNAATITITNYYYREDVRVAPIDSSIAADKDIPCPYRGLFHFGPNDADVFFGREIFIQELYSATKTHNFIPVLGASGSGKSSVVLAGLVPKLQKEGHWQFTHFRPGSNPFYALAEALVPLYTPGLNETDKLALAYRIAGYLQDGSLLLSDVFVTIRQNHPDYRVLLIADQFEEIYTLCNNQEIRRQFLDCLLASLETPTSLSSSATVLVATMRADFLGNALSYRPFADVLQNADVKLGPMNREELTQVIEKPAQKLGVTFESGLVERILEDVENQPGNLPLLEFALTELWNKRTGKQLTHKIYEEISQVEGALARHADKKYGNLTEEEKEKVRRIFLQLVRPGEGSEDTKRIVTKAELGEQSWDLVKRLADYRLVVTSLNSESGQETVEIAHEALIRNWRKLREWMDTNRVFRVWQERLRVAMEQWQVYNKDEGSLLRGAALEQAKEMLKERREDLSLAEQEFIHASLTLQERQKKKGFGSWFS